MHSNHGFSPDDLGILRRVITDAVRKHLDTRGRYDPRLRDRLQNYERTAWDIGLDAHTLQIINSGRRLLGDHVCLRPERGQPSYDMRSDRAALVTRAG